MLKNAWYCAALSNELEEGAVVGRKLLGQRLAFFRTSSGAVHAVAAVCPHRGADLGWGRVVGDTLQCPLHGWRFDASGRCVHVPSQPAELKIPPKAKCQKFEVREQQGVIWLWAGDAGLDVPPPPRHEEWDDGPGRARYFEPSRLWACSFVNAVENAIDTTHIPFIHQETLGAESRSLYPKQALVVDEDLRGFSGRDASDSPWGAGRKSAVNGKLGKLIVARLLGLAPVRDEYYRFDLGGSLFYKASYESGTWDVLVAHSTPADSSHTWFFGISFRTRALSWPGERFQRWFSRTLCDEDEREVSSMLSNDASLLPHPVSVVGDEPLLTFRRIYQHHLQLQNDLGSTPAAHVVRSLRTPHLDAGVSRRGADVANEAEGSL